MLQNMLITSLTPLSNKTEANSWENQPFAHVWPEKLHHKARDITRTIKKKPKRVRTAFSTEQLRTLERTYTRYKYIDTSRRNELARSLNIGEKCVKIWFQNRRMKEKKESSGSSSDTSSECYSTETPSITTSPPPQVTSDLSQNDYGNQYHQCNSEYSYQVPTYYGNNIAHNMYGFQPNVSGFYNDTNVYPTHYYPIDMNYGAEGNGFNNYGSEVSHYWTPNPRPYYTSI